MITREEFHDYCQGKSIAILGNSRILLNTKRGELFDSHQVVLRMNMGYPKAAYQEFLGKRTDVWSAAMTDQDKQRRYHALFNERKYTLWPWHDVSVMVSELKPNAFAFPASFYQEIHAECGSVPSTGCLILSYFLRKIDYQSLTVAGFDFFTTPNFHRSKVMSAHHQPAREKEFLSPALEGARDVLWIR